MADVGNARNAVVQADLYSRVSDFRFNTMSTTTPVTLLLTAELLDKLRPYQQEHDITSVPEAILTILHEHLGIAERPTPPFSPSPSIYDGVEDGACEVLTEYLGA